MVHMSSSWSTGLGFDLAWFSFLSSKRLCIFGLHGAIYELNFFLQHSLPFDELNLVGLALDLVDYNHCPSVL